MEIKDLGVRGAYRLQNLRNQLWRQGETLDDVSYEIERIKKYLKIHDAEEHPRKKRRLDQVEVSVDSAGLQDPEVPLPAQVSSLAYDPEMTATEALDRQEVIAEADVK